MTESNLPEPTPSPAATIRLDHFLKLMNLVETGGQAKLMIQSGLVKVNGVLCLTRRKKLLDGDVVHFQEQELVVGIE